MRAEREGRLIRPSTIFNFNNIMKAPDIESTLLRPPVNHILVEREKESMINKVLIKSQKLLDGNYQEMLVKEGIDERFKNDVLGVKPTEQGKVLFKSNINKEGSYEQSYNQLKYEMCEDFMSSEAALGKFFLRF